VTYFGQYHPPCLGWILSRVRNCCPDHHERFKSRDDIVSFKSRHIHVVFIKVFGWAAVGENQCIRTVNL
jgi:hypothetical protein